MKFLFVFAGWIFVISTVKGQLPHQNPKFGADSTSRVQCAKNLSTMNEFVKINLFDRAWDSWLEAYHSCPASSKNIYIHGVKILKHRIETSTDESVKSGYVDSLMVLHDNRIKYFGQEGYVLGRKGIDLIKYRPADAPQAYNYLSKSIQLEGAKSDEAVMVTFMQASYLAFKSGKIEASQMVADYLMASSLVEQIISAGNTEEGMKKAQEAIDKLFAESGVADCQTLISIFQPKYDAAPKDVELLKKIVQLLGKSKCEDQILYAQASESLFAIEPSAQAAFYLARLFYKKEAYAKSAEYYKKAIDLETSEFEKANYYYQLGVVQQLLGDHIQARVSARTAINLRPQWGEPYILIGNLYASSARSCGSNGFEQGAVFWAAVDQYQKAKAIDTSVTATAQDLINRYSVYFPNNEDAFFNGYTDGKPFSIGCWIGETTTVRTIKKQ